MSVFYERCRDFSILLLINVNFAYFSYYRCFFIIIYITTSFIIINMDNAKWAQIPDSKHDIFRTQVLSWIYEKYNTRHLDHTIHKAITDKHRPAVYRWQHVGGSNIIMKKVSTQDECTWIISVICFNKVSRNLVNFNFIPVYRV